MAQVLIMFRKTESRDCYVCANITMYDGDVVALDTDTQKKEIGHYLISEKSSGNFVEVHDVAPTVEWEEMPPELNNVRFIEELERTWASASRLFNWAVGWSLDHESS